MSQVPDTAVRPRKRAAYSSRELYFATYHQAAHAVVAAMLGCRVDHLEIGFQPESIGWNPECAPTGDFETICAAGFAMELILGRRHDVVWDPARDDRATLRAITLDRTGGEMSPEETARRFTEGSEHCRSILNHSNVRIAVDQVAEALGDAYLANEEGLKGADVHQMIGTLVDFEASKAHL